MIEDEIPEDIKFKPWLLPNEEEIMKHFTIDPNNLSTTSLMSPLVKKAELNYFNSLSNI